MKISTLTKRFMQHKIVFLRFIIALLVVGVTAIGVITLVSKFHKPEASASHAATLHSDGVTWLAGLTELSAINQSEETSYLQLASNIQNLKTTKDTFKKSLEKMQSEESLRKETNTLIESSKQIESATNDVADRYAFYEKALNYNFNEDFAGIKSGEDASSRLQNTENALTSIKRGEPINKGQAGAVAVRVTVSDEVSKTLEDTLGCIANLKRVNGSLESEAAKCQTQYKNTKSAIILEIQDLTGSDQAYAAFSEALRPFSGKTSAR